jgi:cell division protein ZapC
MPKSWFFDVSDECVYCDVGKLFQLNCGYSKVLALVIANGLQAATVMILSQYCQLSENKSLAQFDIIKVMHNRLHPLRKAKQVVAA